MFLKKNSIKHLSHISSGFGDIGKNFLKAEVAPELKHYNSLGDFESVQSRFTKICEKVRRTDDELSKDKTGLDKSPESYSRASNVPLSTAIYTANYSPGVYILYLNGKVMKCVRSAQFGGVKKRLMEYYRLDYDIRAKSGDYWAVNESNRDSVVVSWQCCPVSKCHELEYKLFKKYGKGPWAQRSPVACFEDSWELLI